MVFKVITREYTISYPASVGVKKYDRQNLDMTYIRKLKNFEISVPYWPVPCGVPYFLRWGHMPSVSFISRLRWAQAEIWRPGSATH